MCEIKTTTEIRRMRIGGQGTFLNKKWWSEKLVQEKLKELKERITYVAIKQERKDLFLHAHEIKVIIDETMNKEFEGEE